MPCGAGEATAADSLIPGQPAIGILINTNRTWPLARYAPRGGIRIQTIRRYRHVGYTKIQIMGNLGGTPEMKFLPSGDPVVNFSVAVNRRYKDREGNQKEATDWFRVCAFNGVGEACAKHLQKGDGIFVEGRLQVRQYDSKQNGREVSVEIIPSVVRFLGSSRTESAERPTPGRPSAGTRDASNGADGTDEDVPF